MRLLVVVVLASCAPAPSPPPPSPPSPSTPPPPAPLASSLLLPLPFVRRPPPAHQRASVDACAYGKGRACIDALVREPDPVRVRYMRRIGGAQQRGAIAGDDEIAECCNVTGPCGAPKRTGHADCPAMDDGYACLVAAERQRADAHARACRCDPERAALPVPGGSLACDGRDRPVARAALDAREAHDVLARSTCDGAEGRAACAAEIARLANSDPELAQWIDRVHVTRCRAP